MPQKFRSVNKKVPKMAFLGIFTTKDIFKKCFFSKMALKNYHFGTYAGRPFLWLTVSRNFLISFASHQGWLSAFFLLLTTTCELGRCGSMVVKGKKRELDKIFKGNFIMCKEKTVHLAQKKNPFFTIQFPTIERQERVLFLRKYTWYLFFTHSSISRNWNKKGHLKTQLVLY